MKLAIRVRHVRYGLVHDKNIGFTRSIPVSALVSMRVIGTPYVIETMLAPLNRSIPELNTERF